MKGILVIIDGAGDLANKQLNGKTPLEAAKIPNLDFLVTRGEMGYMYPVKPGYSPGSDEAILSIFGNDLKNSTRGQLEAHGTEVKLSKGDIALRVNFATVKKNGEVVDRRCGRTLRNKEAKKLAETINKMEFSHEFELVSTVQHRGVLVIRGNFSDKVAGDDITYRKGHSKEITEIIPCKPLARTVKAKKTAEILNEFLKSSSEVLRNHPVNIKRQRKGFLPANYLLVRAPGVSKPKLKQYKKWIATNTMPLEVGFAKFSGMKNFAFKYPKLKKLDAYDNLWKGLKKKVKHSIRVIRKNMKKADYCYVHFKETDLPGHDNKPIEKKKMIEYLDKHFFSFIRKIAPLNEIKVVVTADHSTPCKLKTHSADPVPVLLYNGKKLLEKKTFNEKEAKKGKLGRILGKDLFKKVGFVK
ncbi:2,3-bisphosphoglycerate-independent phosphoglycerate mutase [archaeon]|jgi:2,3-bisphosphoglycerate-independent phosphoglycerate mutase|nr:2,3-bisphosphoglycerate-independent phosphoglycerate mutase [archaeon]